MLFDELDYLSPGSSTTWRGLDGSQDQISYWHFGHASDVCLEFLENLIDFCDVGGMGLLQMRVHLLQLCSIVE
jgi:hypothetical protein